MTAEESKQFLNARGNEVAGDTSREEARRGSGFPEAIAPAALATMQITHRYRSKGSIS